MKRARLVRGLLACAASLALLAILWVDWTSSGSHPPAEHARAAAGPVALRAPSVIEQPLAAPSSERSTTAAPDASAALALPATPAPSTPLEELDAQACFASLMSDEPDLVAVTEWAERFAHAMEVDPASVEVDPRTGRVKGRLAAPAGLGAATFSIEGARFEVSIWPRASGPDAAQVPLRSMVWRFENDLGAPGKAGLFLQNHPDTHGSVVDFVGERDERVVGWSFAASDRGTAATPVVARVARDEPGAWIIGRPQTTPGGEWPGYFIDGSHKVLLGKLAPYAKP